MREDKRQMVVAAKAGPALRIGSVTAARAAFSFFLAAISYSQDLIIYFNDDYTFESRIWRFDLDTEQHRHMVCLDAPAVLRLLYVLYFNLEAAPR
jgi:hypothetical protein